LQRRVQQILYVVAVVAVVVVVSSNSIIRFGFGGIFLLGNARESLSLSL
jgi:hypothetical protein